MILKENEIYAFRVEGQTVIAKVEAILDTSFELVNVYQLAFMRDPNNPDSVNIGLIDFMPGISVDKKVSMRKEAISGVANVSKELSDLYLQQTTGIQLAS